MKRSVLACLLCLLIASGLHAQFESALWGVNGELWDPGNSRLDNFTNEGYMQGNQPIPEWPIGVYVTDFGAIPDDDIDDADAFMAAIEACPAEHAVFVPNGRYIIKKQIIPNRDYFVLRGEDMYQTVLYMPKYLNEIYVQDVGYDPALETQPKSLGKKGFWRVDAGTHRSIENLTFEFREQRKMGHWEHKGNDPIVYTGSVRDSWLRNIYIVNADHALKVGAKYISVFNVIMDNTIDRPSLDSFLSPNGGATGHMGLDVNFTFHCVFHNIEQRGRYLHGIDLNDGSGNNVFSQIYGDSIWVQHHGGSSHNNVYTDIDVKKSAPLGLSFNGGAVSETHWNYRGETTLRFGPVSGTNWPVMDKDHVYVGFDGGYVTTSTPDAWYEAIAPDQLNPQNIYLAQMELLGKLGNVYLEPMPEPPSRLVGDVLQLPSVEQCSAYLNDKDSPHPPEQALAFDVSREYGYLKFDLSGLDLASISRVRLRVSAMNIGNAPFTLGAYMVADDSWSEETLTFNNRPPEAALIDSVDFAQGGRGQMIDFDVTPFIQAEWQGDKVASLVIRSVNGGGFLTKIRGRLLGFPPRLIIEQIEDPVPGAPSAPTGVQSESLTGNIRLDWNDNPEADVVSYNVYRSESSADFKNYGEPVISGLSTSDGLDLNATSDWSIGQISDAKVYYYRVTAVDRHKNESEPSIEFVGTTLHDPTVPNDPPVFQYPINLANATARSSYNTSLAGAATDTEGDTLYFFKVSGPEWLNVSLDGTLSGTPDIDDAGINEFLVQVNSRGGRDQATISIVVDLPLDSPAGAPNDPSGLDAVAGNNSVNLTWNPNSEADIYGYKIYRSSVSGSYGPAIDWVVGASAYTDSTVENGTTYFYKVTAVDRANNESNLVSSPEVLVVPFDSDPAPASPTGLNATAGDFFVELNWNANGESDLAGYAIYRSSIAGHYYGDPIATGVVGSSYVDRTAINGITYYYTITALDSAGHESIKSNEDLATPSNIAPVPPSGLKTIADDGRVRLFWDDNTDHDWKGYNLYRSTDPATKGTLIAGGLSTSVYTDFEVTNGTRYYYVVTAYDTSSQESAASNQASVIPLAPLPIYHADFGTDIGKQTIATAGFTPIMKSGSATSDELDHARVAMTSWWTTGSVLKSFPEMAAPSGLDLRLSTRLISSQTGQFGSAFGLQLFTTSATINSVENSGLFVGVTENRDAVILSGVLGSEIAREPLGFSISSGEVVELLISVTHGDYGVNDLQITLQVIRGSDLKTMMTTVNSADFGSADLFGLSIRGGKVKNPINVDFDYFSAVELIDVEPDAPTGLQAFAGEASVALLWDANSEPDVTSYSVYRREISGAYGEALVSGFGTPAYVDNTALNNTTYVYRVTATNANEYESPPSLEVEATPEPILPPALGDETAQSIDSTSAQLSGVVSGAANAEVWLYWGPLDGGTTVAENWEHVESLGIVAGGTPFSITLSGLLENTSYWFRFYTSNPAGSDWSDQAFAFSGLPIDTSIGPNSGIPVSSGLVLHLDADDVDGDGTAEGLSESGLSGSTLSLWSDKSASANHATTRAGTPTLVPNAVNGHAIVRTTDHNSWLDFRDITDIGTVFWVLAESPQASDLGFLLGDDGRYHFHRGSTKGPMWSGNFASSGVKSGTTRLNGVTVDGTVTAPPLGDLGIVSLVTASNVEASQITRDRTSGSRSWNGDIAEILIYNRALTSEEEAAVGAYLAWKYNLETNYLSFDGGSPVKNRAPTNLTTTSATLNATLVTEAIPGEVSVYWGTVDGGTDTGAWEHSAFVGSYTNITTAISYSVGELLAGQTYYVSFAASIDGINYWAEPSWQFTTPAGDQEPPLAPTGLDVVSGDQTVTLTWNANEDPDLASYRVYRSELSGNPGTLVAQDLIDPLFVDEGLTNGSTYYYTVTAVDQSTNESANSEEAEARPLAEPTLAYTVDFGTLVDKQSISGAGFTSVSEGNSNTSDQTDAARLTITSSYRTAGILRSFPELAVSGGLGFEISATLDNTNVNQTKDVFGIQMFAPSSSIAGIESEGLFVGVNKNQEAVILAGLYALENKADAIVLANEALGFTIADGELVHLSATVEYGIFGADDMQVTLVVTRGSDSKILVSSLDSSSLGNGDLFGLAARQGGTSKTMTVNYDVFSVQTSGAQSPTAASGLMANPGSGFIQLNWSDNSKNEVGFIVERSATPASGFTAIMTTSANATSYTDTGLAPGTTYYYRVIATNSSGNSAPSNEASATTYTEAESWRDQYFGQTANEGVAADSYDYDGDGLSNLLERAFGTAPNDAASAVSMPQAVVINDAGTAYLSLTYRQLVGGVGAIGVDYTSKELTYTVEYNNKLTGQWSSGAVTPIGTIIDNLDGTETVTVRLNAPITREKQQFIRLKVSTNL